MVSARAVKNVRHEVVRSGAGAMCRFQDHRDRRPRHRVPDVGQRGELGDRVDLQTVGRGQEFVLDVREYLEAVAWVRQLLVG